MMTSTAERAAAEKCTSERENSLLSAQSYRFNLTSMHPEIQARLKEFQEEISAKRHAHQLLITMTAYFRVTVNKSRKLDSNVIDTDFLSRKPFGEHLSSIASKIASVFASAHADPAEYQSVISLIDLNRVLEDLGFNLSKEEHADLLSTSFSREQEYISLQELNAIVFDRLNVALLPLFRLEVLEETLGARYLTCAQLSVLIQRFPGGECSISVMGNYRVEIAVRFFSLLSDPENFEIVAACLSESEVVRVVYRLGISIASHA
jgi:hypothetical protein